jgi:hypothetical protein
LIITLLVDLGYSAAETAPQRDVAEHHDRAGVEMCGSVLDALEHELISSVAGGVHGRRANRYPGQGELPVLRVRLSAKE